MSSHHLNCFISTDNSPSPRETIITQRLINNVDFDGVELNSNEITNQIANRDYGILSALQHFPAEVLGDIFRIGIILDPRPSALLRICCVCQFWRAVATSIPELWSNLVLGEGINYTSPYFESQLHRWVERAGGLPLSLYSILTPKSTSISHPYLSKAHFWTNVHVEASSYAILRPFFNKGSCDICPRLESLTLICLDQGSVLLDDNPIPLYLSDMPRLTTLNLKMPECLNMDDLLVPWSQLIHLHLDIAANCVEFLSILEETPNLEECFIRFSGSEYEFEEPHLLAVSIRLEKLRKLRVEEITYMSPFFSPLELPLLEHLLVGTDKTGKHLEEEFQVHQVISELIERSNCLLQELVLSYVDIKRSEYKSMADHLSLGTQVTLTISRPGYFFDSSINIDAVDARTSTPITIKHTIKAPFPTFDPDLP